VVTLCRVMKVSRSGYYAWLECKPCARAREDARLLRKVRVLHERFATRAAERAAIYEFIELYYNPVRQHSYLHGMSPMEFESARLR